MEAGLVRERTCDTREPGHVSQSIPLYRELRPIELATDEEKKETENCEHFTIRGYVADVRKKNANTCLPFFVLHNHKSDEYANLFPPLPVTKFRRWNCESCLHEADDSAAVVSNVALIHSQNDEVKGIGTLLGSTILASHSDEEILLPGFRQLPKGKIVGEQSLAANNSVNVSNGESRHSIYPAKEENESVFKHLTREDLDIPKVRSDICEGSGNQSSDISTSVAIEGKACPEKQSVVLSIHTSGTAHDKNDPNMLYAISEGTELVHEISDCDMTADPSFVVDDIAISGQKQYNDMTRCVGNISSMVLDENDEEASDSDMGLTEYTAKHKKRANRELIADNKLQRKKARKVRLLDDIMSDKLVVKPKEVCVSSEDTKDGQSEVDTDKRPDTCKVKFQHLDSRSHLLGQKAHVEPSKSRARYLTHENGDEGPSLMYWLKRATKQVMTHKRHTEMKPTDPAVARSKSCACASAEKCFHYAHKVPRTKGNKSEVLLRRKQNEMPCGPLKPQQDIMNGKYFSVADSAAMNSIHAQTTDSEFNGFLANEQTPHRIPKIKDNSHRKASLHKKKSKAPQVEGDSFQMQLSKVSFGKHVLENITDVHKPKQVTRKKRTARVSKNEALDDIPMDIVELLAKNQHQRRLVDVKEATVMMTNLSEMTKSMDQSALTTGKGHEKLMSDAVPADLFKLKTLSNNMINCLGNYRSIEHSPNSVKQNIPMGLNRQDITVASSGIPVIPEYGSQHMSSAQSPNCNSRNSCFPQNCGWFRGGMPTPEPSHTDRAISHPNVGTNSHGLSSVLLDGVSFRIKPQNASTDPSYLSPLCPDFLLQGKLNTDTYERERLKLVNQGGTHLLNIKEQVENKETFRTATSFEKVGDTVYPNEIIPAMHLLKLMDSVTWSGVSHKPSDVCKLGFTQESDFCFNDRNYEPTGSIGKAKTSLVPQHPLVVEHPFICQCYGNTCKPPRPRPRIGVLGSLLQQEIAPLTNNGRTQFGLGIGQCNKLKSHETNRKETSQWPHTVNNNKMNDQNLYSRNENMKQPTDIWGTQFGAKFRDSSPSKYRDTNGKMKPECSPLATHSNVLNAQTPISRNENPKQLFPGISSIRREDTIQVNNNCGEAARQLLKMELCVLNQNPADFTILDEDNEYMIASKDLKHRHTTHSGNLKCPSHTGGQKRQKVMKLTALTGYVRS